MVKHKVKLTIDQVKFHLEENYCVDNLIDQLSSEVEEASQKSICGTCYRASVKWLGKVDASS